MSDSEGKNPDSTVAIFYGGFRTLGRKHRAVLDFRGRDRWLIDGNQSIDVTFFARILLQGGTMTRRFLILSFAAGLLTLCLGGHEARAGQVPLIPPTGATLDTLIGGPPPAGPYAIVGNLEFSNFQYSTADNSGGPAPLPPASGVNVNALTGVTGETGLSFSGSFIAPAMSSYDYKLSYTVTALSGTISDTYLAVVGGPLIVPGTGVVSINELITTTGGAQLAQLLASSPGTAVATASFAPQTSIVISKDITLLGGSTGGTFSIVNQGYSSTAVPEPASMALLGIGLSGLLTLRRFLKRSVVS